MESQPASNPTSKRNQVLVYALVLGLALILAVIASSGQGSRLPVQTPTASLPAPSPTTTPTLADTSTSIPGTPTPLPAIPPTPDENIPSPLGVTSADLQGLEVSLWHPWTGAQAEALQRQLDEFNATNRWGIRLQAVSFDGYGSLEDAVQTALEADSLPDVMAAYGNQAQRWDEGGALADLAPYVDDPVWGLSPDEQAGFSPDFWVQDLVPAAGNESSRRLGVPYYRSAYVLFYNHTWADELGYPSPPANPEDFRLRACAASAQAGSEAGDPAQGMGGWLVTDQPGILLGWIYGFGGSLTAPGEQGYQFNTQPTRLAMAYLKGLQDAGCAWTDPEVNPLEAFANREALFIVASLFDIPAQQEAFSRAGSLDEWSVIPFPSATQNVVVAYGPSLFIARSTPARQLAAWLAIEWLLYPPNQAEWARSLGSLPTHKEALAYLEDAAGSNPQWAQALELLPIARSEPSLASWGVMRWALGDALSELFDPEFALVQVPSLLIRLDHLAQEITGQVP